MKRLSPSDMVALAAIAATILLIIVRRDRFPVFVDIYYHLSVMEMFDQAGGIVAHDFLQFAPEGRDHLYPPLLHLCMLAMNKAGITTEAIGAMVSAGIYPLILCTIWFIVRETFSRKAASMGVLLLLTSWSFFYTTAVVSAAGIATILALWTYYFTSTGRWLSASLTMALCIYSHLSYPHLIALSLALIAILDPRMRAVVPKILGIAYALALPWVVLVIVHRDAISQTSMDGGLQQVELLLVMLAAGGFVLSCRKLRGSDATYAVPVAMLAAMMPILFFYPSRFFVHGSVPLAILGGIFLSEAVTGIGARTGNARVPFAAVMCALMLIVMTGGITAVYGGSVQRGMPQQEAPPGAPDIQESAQNGLAGLRFRTSTSVLPTLIQDDILGVPSYLQQANARVIRAVTECTGESDVIVTQPGMLGCMITAFTGRATTTGMFRETANDTGPPVTPPEFDTYRIFTGTQPVLVLEGALQDIPPAFPWWAAFLLLAAALAGIGYGGKKGI